MTPPQSRHRQYSEQFTNGYLALSAAVMVALVVVVVILLLRQSSISGAEHNSAVLACQEANGNRTEDVQIFKDILSLPAIAKPQFITPAMRTAQEKALVQVNANIKAAYALRDCARLYSTG
jgi:hypothetical protein